MAARRTGLGRGLESLIPATRPELGFAAVPVDRIDPNPDQPRTQFEDGAIESLAQSVREVGVLQPIVVRPADDGGRYTLVAGERRWRAARLAGLAEIPAMIRDEEDDTGNLTEALIENVQREDLTPLEEAAAYRQLLDDHGLTHEEIGSRVGKSRTAVTNTLRLLGLPGPIQGLLERGALSAGHARALLGIDDTAYAVHIAEKAASEGWSVRQVEEAARDRRPETTPARPKLRTSKPRPPAIIELEERLAEELGSKVKIDYSGDKGKVVVAFTTLDDLERIYKRLIG